jgi:hypothetical protein
VMSRRSTQRLSFSAYEAKLSLCKAVNLLIQGRLPLIAPNTSVLMPGRVEPKRSSLWACGKNKPRCDKARDLRAQRLNWRLTCWAKAHVCRESVENCKMRLHRSSGTWIKYLRRFFPKSIEEDIVSVQNR